MTHSFASFSRHRLSLLVVPLLAGLGCSSPDLSGPTSLDLTQLPWTVSLNTHAILMDTLPPYNTLQLTAIPLSATGDLLPGNPQVTFTTSDSSLRVSSTGLLTARRALDGVKVRATILYRGIRVTDSAVVNITASTNPPAFQQFMFQLAPTDSPRVAAPGGLSFFYTQPVKNIYFGAIDPNGTRIPHSIVALEVSDSLQAGLRPQGQVGTGVRQLILEDTSANIVLHQLSQINMPVTIYGSATVYGVTMRDSMQVLVLPPVHLVYSFRHDIPPGSTTPVWTVGPATPRLITRGGWVWWVSLSLDPADSVDVVFDDPTLATADVTFFGGAFSTGGGDIPAFPGGDLIGTFDLSLVRSRQFLTPGTVHWHSPRTGLSGSFTVE